MLNLPRELIGLTIKSTLIIHDYFQVIFEGDVILTINNVHSVCQNHLRVDEIPEGILLKQIIESDENILMIFTDEFQINIDLSDSAYIGPEAFTLSFPGRPLIVLS